MPTVSPHDPLTAQQKEVLRLHEDEHLTHREIAVRFGVTHHRIRQVLATARARLADCAAHGDEALSLLPQRLRDFLEWNELVSTVALRAAIDSNRLAWDGKWKRLILDGKNLRFIGWHCWQMLCVRAGLPKLGAESGQ